MMVADFDRDAWLRDIAAETSKAELTALESFHRMLTTLASGAIALSIVFLEKVVPSGGHASKQLFIIGAWIAFAAAIVGSALAFLSVHQLYAELATFTVDMALNSNPPDGLRRVKFWKRLTMAASYCALSAFTVGVGSFIIFAVANLR